jgi:hypothetical protein
MKTTLGGWALLALGLGCGTYQPLQSNPGAPHLVRTPDGGEIASSCPLPFPGEQGAASLSGPQAFTVVTALEEAEVWIPSEPDGGMGNPTTPQITLFFYDQDVPCKKIPGSLADAPRRQPDGGLPWNRLLRIDLNRRDGTAPGPGRYRVDEVPDAGRASAVLYTYFDGGFSGLEPFDSGEVDLDGDYDCSVNGAFELHARASPDSPGTFLSGTFSNDFCY